MSKTEARKIVFDIGVWDGADTEYYLEMGYNVVGIEANPVRVAELENQFAPQIKAGTLVVVGMAVAEREGTATLFSRAERDGSNSLYPWGRAVEDWPGEKVEVPTVTITSLLARYGVPYFMKVDIEAADRLAVLPLTMETAPQFLSFEAMGDALELLEHAAAIGYRQFKILHQGTHREMSRVNILSDRIRDRARRIARLPEPSHVVRNGRRFRTSGCSGPMPEWSDGPWRDYATVAEQWRAHKVSPVSGGWWDIHASRT